MNFFEVLYAKKNGTALPANFFDLLFAKNFTPATVWGEYDGTLPAQYSANGSDLADYRIYGAAGGVGDRTINLFDISAKNSVVAHSNIAQPTAWNVYDGDAETLRCPCEGNKAYTVSIPEISALFRIATTSSSSIPVRNLPVSVTRIVSTENIRSYTFTTPEDAKFILCQFAITTSTEMRHAMCINEGNSAPPAGNVVPYGYEVDMYNKNSEENINTAVPIYIGSAPFEEDEYVSFKEQKVYRRTENLWNGVWRQGNILSATGESDNDPYFAHTEHMQCQSLTNLAIKYFGQVQSGADVRGTIAYYDSNDDFMVAYTWGLTPFSDSYITKLESVETGAAYVALSFAVDYNYIELSPETAAPLLVTGSDTLPTADTQYIPYLQPTDPPVPLPTLPTVDGVNVVDYAGQSVAPSRFYAKYRKG